MVTSEQRLVETLVHLADTLVRDFDVLDLFDYLVEAAPHLVNVDEAGLLLATEEGTLQVVAVTSESVKIVELFQLRSREGPCVDVYDTGDQVVSSLNDPAALQRWPVFSEAARDAGFEAVCAVPMRLRDQVLGGLNLFSRSDRLIEDRDLMAAQALADIASIAILQHRATEDASVLVGQLETALQSRVVIEQAKGMISEKLGVGVDEAFSRLRSYSRDGNRGLRVTAEAIVTGELDPGSLPASR